MHRLRGLRRGGRLLLALAVGGAIFGIASVVQADIPDSGVIHGCYGKAGTPYKGQLRVRDASQGEQCRIYENELDWNQTGPTGPTGPAGVPGLAISPVGANLTAGGPANLTIPLFCADSTKIAIGGYVFDQTNPGNLAQLGAGNAGVLTGGAATDVWEYSLHVVAATAGDTLQFQIVCANPPVGTAAPVRGSSSTSKPTVKITTHSLP